MIAIFTGGKKLLYIYTVLMRLAVGSKAIIKDEGSS